MKSISLTVLILSTIFLFNVINLEAVETDRKKMFPISGIVSSSVSDAIKRNTSAIKKNFTDPLFTQDSSKLPIVSEPSSFQNYSVSKPLDFINLLNSSVQKDKNESSQDNISLEIVIFNKSESVHLLTKYELQSLNDDEERFDCEKECKINISKIAGLKRFKLLSEKTFPTSIEVSLEDKVELLSTTFEKNYFLKTFLSEFPNYDPLDISYLLIRNDSSIVDTELDRKYLKKVILDENFNVITNSVGAYNLFVGVGPGLVNLLSKNSKGLLYRPVFLARGELLILENEIDVYDLKNVELFQMGALATVASPLNVYEDSITNFSNESKTNRIGPNNFQFNNVLINPSGKYFFDIREREINYVIGTDFNAPVVIPDKDLQSLIETRIGAEAGDPDFCMTQLNFSKKIRSLKYSSEDELGPGDVVAISLDEEGNFSDDRHENARKVFFHSYKFEGIFYKIIFEDGSKYENETFCSPGNRVIEQI